MAATTLDANRWQPTRPGGFGIGAVLALLAHALLVGALALGVSWRSRPSDVVMSAELWSAVPQVAAPELEAPPPAPPTPEPRPAPPPEPATPTREAQIAIEQAAKKKREQELEEQRKEKERARKLKEEQEARARAEKAAEKQRRKDAAAKAAAARAAEERLARQREENLARIRGQAGATGAPTATGTAKQDAALSAAYAGRIKARIKPNIVLTAEISGNPVTEVEVRCTPDGRIVGRRIVKPSGNPVWDDTVLRAIDRTEVLPRNEDGRTPPYLLLVFPRQE